MAGNVGSNNKNSTSTGASGSQPAFSTTTTKLPSLTEIIGYFTRPSKGGDAAASNQSTAGGSTTSASATTEGTKLPQEKGGDSVSASNPSAEGSASAIAAKGTMCDSASNPTVEGSASAIIAAKGTKCPQNKEIFGRRTGGGSN